LSLLEALGGIARPACRAKRPALHDRTLTLTMQGFGQHEPLIRLDLHRDSLFLSPRLSVARVSPIDSTTISALRRAIPKV